MIFRFCSGSTTPARRSRKSFEASTKTSGSFNRSKRFRTCVASSSLNTPLSTKMHVSLSPTARWMMSAATVESTPPLNAHATRPSPDLRADLRRRLFHEGRHGPVAGAPAHAVREVPENLEAPFGVDDLRVEENRVEPADRIRHPRNRRVRARGDDGEALRRRRDEVAVARPHADFRRHVHEQGRRGSLAGHAHDGVPVLALRGRRDPPPQ